MDIIVMNFSVIQNKNVVIKVNREKILKILYGDIYKVIYSALMKKKYKNEFFGLEVGYRNIYAHQRHSLQKVKNTLGNALVLIQNLSEYEKLDESGIYENEKRYVENACKCIKSNKVVDIDYLIKAYNIIMHYNMDSNNFEDVDLQLLYECINNGSEDIEAAIKKVIDKAVKFKNILMYYIYSIYHKIFDKELYEIVCLMFDKQIHETKYEAYFFKVNDIEGLTAFSQMLFSKIYSEIKDGIEDFSKEVYEDFWQSAKIYNSLQKYEQPVEDVLSEVEIVLNSKRCGNPKGPADRKIIYKSNKEKYRKKLIKIVRKNLIINLDTDYRKAKGKEINLRTVRRNSLKIAELFGLGVKYVEIESCPRFLLDDLWGLLKKFGIKGYEEEKLQPDTKSIIDKKRIEMFGRLYLDIFLMYAFDKNNYVNPYNIKEAEKFNSIDKIVNKSLQNEEVRMLLYAYKAALKESDDGKIIKEILCEK